VAPATRTGLGFLLSRIGLKGLDRCMIKNQKKKKASVMSAITDESLLVIVVVEVF
jgi:hypothetical protein